MPSPDLVLTLDIGTGSTRACVYSVRQAQPLAIAVRDCPIRHPGPDRAEWDSEDWWRAMIEAMAEAVVRAGRASSDYLGITVTSLRQGFVLVDAKGMPLAPGVLNYDRRGASSIPEIEETIAIDDLYQLCGHWHAPELTLPKLLWFRHSQPELWSRAYKMLFVHDWALYRLSGAYATNATLVSAGQMADIQERTWATGLLAKFSIPDGLLSPVYEGGQQIGNLLPEVAAATGLAAGIPVHAGGGDTQFGCLGVDAMHSGEVVIVGGSTTPILLTYDRPIIDPLRYPWVSTHLLPGYWSVECIAGQTGMIYKWFRDTFARAEVQEARRQGLGDYELLNELAAKTPIGAEGLLVVAPSPRWAQDTWQNKAPYSIHNFNLNHEIGHIARAILEGVCYGIRGNLEQLERVAGHSFDRITFTGGSANVPLWAQMLADVLGRPLLVPDVVEPAARAGAQLVLWDNGMQESLPMPVSLQYEPDLTRTKLYDTHYHAYLDVFETMQRCFAEKVD